jgi:tetratricopeptide (TPR) repeat protein
MITPTPIKTAPSEHDKKSQDKKNWIFVGACAFIMLGLLGVWVLVNPQNPFTGMFRSEISDTGGRVIRGPYPTTKDFKTISKAGVTTIVSLLDSRLPYEAVLLDQEREEAAKYGIKVLNFPMASVLGQRLGDDYKARVSAAADSIEKANGKVYLHCYLGVHRGKDVEKVLIDRGVTTGEYVMGEKDSNGVIVENAEVLYEREDYENAIRTASAVANSNSDFSTRALHVIGWSQYQQKNYPAAYETFRTILSKKPVLVDANNGLAFAALQMKQYDVAERYFKWVTENQKESASAHFGLASCYYRQAKKDLARTHAEAAFKLNPKMDEAKVILDKLNPIQTASVH